MLRGAWGVEIAGRAIRAANTVAEAFLLARAEGIAIGEAIAERAWATAAPELRGAEIELEVLVFDREGGPAGAQGIFRRIGEIACPRFQAHHSRPLKRR